MTTNVQSLNEKIIQCQDRYNKILLVVGTFGSGKTKLFQNLSRSYNYPYINLNLTLCEKIINLSSSERGLFEFEEVLMDIFNENSSEVFLLDNIEIVFSPEFKRNPLQLFRHISRNKTIVVSWPGNCKYKKLRYAEPGHSEFFEEKVTDLIIHNLNA